LIKFIFPFIFAKNNDGEFSKYLVVMVIDGALKLGDNPFAASEEFNKRRINLAVVATGTTTFEVENYRTLADYTGLS
jgi:hypothetical protein